MTPMYIGYHITMRASVFNKLYIAYPFILQKIKNWSINNDQLNKNSIKYQSGYLHHGSAHNVVKYTCVHHN